MDKLLTTVLDAELLYDSHDDTFSHSRERFYDVGGHWIAIMLGDARPDRDYNHVAFKIAEDDYFSYLERIEQLGLEVRADRSRVQGEGRSIYFYDYDNHLFELHTGTLQERLLRYQQK